MRKLAIIGSGIAGLGCAWFLRRDHDVTVLEADDHAGGHANTIPAGEGPGSVALDTGFMVFNPVTYPCLTRLFGILGVPVRATDMSFSVRHVQRDIEFSGSSFNHLFAQRRNILRPSFIRMLLRIDRFNREATAALGDPAVGGMDLDAYLRRGGYGADFRDLYLVPMASAVWSAPREQMLRFPAATLLRFFHNHGFLGLHTQHQWWTVVGGARAYVERLTRHFRDRILMRTPVRRVRRTRSGVEVTTDGGPTLYDRVVMACHPPATLALLGDDATPAERRLLTPFRYQPNTATVHTDRSVMPRRRLAWSAWNHRLDASQGRPPTTHYWLNRLQGIAGEVDYFVSINGAHLVRPERVLRTVDYEHPLFDQAAVEAQAGIAGLNAAARSGSETYFAGAWQRYGFHEDGLLSAVNLAALLHGGDPWPRAGAEGAS